MLERSIGAETFQRGVRAYLAKHAWGNATYDDFVGAMTEVAGTDLHPLFDCVRQAVGRAAGLVRARVREGLAADADARAAALQADRLDRSIPKRTWTIPVCVRWGAGKDDRPRLHDARRARPRSSRCPRRRAPTGSCPTRASSATTARPRRATSAITCSRTRATSRSPSASVSIGDVNALVASGDVPSGVALALVAELARDKSRHLVDASIGIVGERRRHGLRQAAPELRALHPQALPGARARARLAEQEGRRRRRQGAAPRAARPGRRRRQGPGADRRGDARSRGSGSTITRPSTPSWSARSSTSRRATATRSCSIASTPRRRRPRSAPSARRLLGALGCVHRSEAGRGGARPRALRRVRPPRVVGRHAGRDGRSAHAR